MEEWFFLGKIILGAILFLLVLNELLLRCYISARTERGALAMTVILYKLGLGIISDILGEEVKDGKSAIRAAARYVLHIRHLSGLRNKFPDIRLAISVKLSQLGLKFDKKLARRMILKIYKDCLDRGIELEIDIEGPETIEDTLACVLPLARFGGEFRQAVASNQLKSEKFLVALARRGIKIRLVKGAYKGDYRDKDAIKFNYWKFAEIAKSYGLDTAYGSHDLEMLSWVQKIWGGRVQKLFGVHMFGPKDWIYMTWGSRKDARPYLKRRFKEGIRPSLFFTFIRNIPESLIWRLRYAPLSFFY